MTKIFSEARAERRIMQAICGFKLVDLECRASVAGRNQDFFDLLQV